MSTSNIAPFGKPIYVMLKPISSVCNMACEYCYYQEKSKLYPEVKPVNQMMTEEILELFIKEYIECQTIQQVLFTWHGGEPLMRPISFYKRALELQKKYAGGRLIENSIQTNGLLLNDEWCHFFKENNFLVGISIDGPEDFHDEYRRNHHGGPSFNRVMKAIDLLKKHDVSYNAMAVIHDYNVDFPLEFYNFFKQINCHYIQFTPVIERLSKHADGRSLTSPKQLSGDIKIAPFTVNIESWGDFLCDIFDEWVIKDVGKYFVQIFDATLANWVGQQPGVCTLAPSCGHAGVMEFNGDVYTCDHYVFPEYKLGNIKENTLTEMMYSPRQTTFGNDKRDKLPTQCKECEYLFACNGECPKNRILITKTGEPGLNFLCDGYKQFFEHVAPYMDFMKKELLEGRPASNVMEWAKQRKSKTSK